jgi:two-component system, OmpR family, sensor histidine kinase MprB
MSLRARLALALAALTAAAVTTMAVVGYRTTASRLYDELDRSLLSSSTRFGDPDGNYARLICNQLARDEPVDEGQQELADLPGTEVQCIGSTGAVFAASSADAIPVDEADVSLAARGGPTVVRTKGDDRIVTVAVRGGAVQLARDLGEVRRVLSSLRTRFALIGVIVTAAAALVGWLVARPVISLTAATEAIVASGRLDADVATDRQDEIGRLAASFAAMLESLRQSREQQQRLAEDAAHELRTPLTSLRTNVDVLRRHPELDPDTKGRILTDIDSELRELSHLTNELVSLVAEDADDEPNQPVELAVLAQSSARRAERRWRHPVTVSVTSRTAVVGQPRRLLRVLDNLLDNACKFDSSTVPIELTVADGTVAVRDHGQGIDPADLERVFDRFYRGPAARPVPGSGLGLSIAREIAVAHGGRLTASNVPGGGAVFTLWLPTPTDAGPSDSHQGLTAPPSGSYIDQPELPA